VVGVDSRFSVVPVRRPGLTSRSVATRRAHLALACNLTLDAHLLARADHSGHRADVDVAVETIRVGNAVRQHVPGLTEEGKGTNGVHE